jgi:aspartyl-tRNA(Asn)/glutamyl-tRNA(Gln) amidotransferase subunit A
MPCEVSANLSRFDGMRYGIRERVEDLMSTYMNTRGKHLGEEVRRRIILGTYALSEGYQDQYYGQAQKLRQMIRTAYAQAFEAVDVIATPTAPTRAYRIGEKVDDPLTMYLGDIYTVGANVAGLPALSVPVDDHEGLPIGMHLMAQANKDDMLIDVGHAYEQARDDVSIYS